MVAELPGGFNHHLIFEILLFQTQNNSTNNNMKYNLNLHIWGETYFDQIFTVYKRKHPIY